MKKIYRSIVQFLHFAKRHKIKVRPNDWWKGLSFLLIGWALIALNIVSYDQEVTSPSIVFGYFIQFLSGLVFIFLLIFILHAFKNKNFLAHKFLAISKINERPGSGIISVKERKILILVRGFLATMGYVGFELAKTSISAIDNSILFSADGLMYAILAMVILKERYGLIEWSGIFLTIIGISIIAFFDFIANAPLIAMFGAMLGLGASTFMAIILILTSVIVQHDYPIRITFYQCLYGLIFTLFLFLIFLPLADLTDHNIYNISFLISSVKQGVIYSLALVCFFRAFYYVDTIVVAISSYSLDLFTIIFSATINSDLPSIKNITSLSVISLGIGILIFAEYRKNKKEETKTK